MQNRSTPSGMYMTHMQASMNSVAIKSPTSCHSAIQDTPQVRMNHSIWDRESNLDDYCLTIGANDDLLD